MSGQAASVHLPQKISLSGEAVSGSIFLIQHNDNLNKFKSIEHFSCSLLRKKEEF
jgi:hypothetical protein